MAGTISRQKKHFTEVTVWWFGKYTYFALWLRVSFKVERRHKTLRKLPSCAQRQWISLINMLYIVCLIQSYNLNFTDSYVPDYFLVGNRNFLESCSYHVFWARLLVALCFASLKKKFFQKIQKHYHTIANLTCFSMCLIWASISYVKLRSLFLLKWNQF